MFQCRSVSHTTARLPSTPIIPQTLNLFATFSLGPEPSASDLAATLHMQGIAATLHMQGLAATSHAQGIFVIVDETPGYEERCETLGQQTAGHDVVRAHLRVYTCIKRCSWVVLLKRWICICVCHMCTSISFSKEFFPTTSTAAPQTRPQTDLQHHTTTHIFTH